MPKQMPPPGTFAVTFTADGLRGLRRNVAEYAQALGLGQSRVDDLVLAVSEVAANSVVHGGGGGTLQIWSDVQSDTRAVTCEIRDSGWIRDLPAEPSPPAVDSTSGRGLWLASRLCDFLRIRSSPSGTAVRLSMNLPTGSA